MGNCMKLSAVYEEILPNDLSTMSHANVADATRSCVLEVENCRLNLMDLVGVQSSAFCERNVQFFAFSQSPPQKVQRVGIICS